MGGECECGRRGFSLLSPSAESLKKYRLSNDTPMLASCQRPNASLRLVAIDHVPLDSRGRGFGFKMLP